MVPRLVMVMMLAGFVYAARATAVRYVEIFRSPFAPHPAASIDEFLEPAHTTAAALRRGAACAGWRPEDAIVVVAADPAISREDLYQVYYSAGYLLYPSTVRVSENPRNPGNPRNPMNPVGVLVFGGPNPFSGGEVEQLSETTALVTLP
jgi:hypothetical protein